MADPCWYDIYPARLVLECLRLRRAAPSFRLRKVGTYLYWVGHLTDLPAGVPRVPAKVMIGYPEAFPAVPPDVFLVSPEIDPNEYGHTWHRWANGEICLVRPSHWNLATTTDEVVAKVADWYFNYSAKKAGLIREMPDIGRAPLAPMDSQE